jgi:hypothetical protein
MKGDFRNAVKEQTGVFYAIQYAPVLTVSQGYTLKVPARTI